MQAMEEDDLDEVVSAFIKQYYSDNAMIPREILTEADPADKELLDAWLTETRGSAVKITVPRRGDKKGAAGSGEAGRRRDDEKPWTRRPAI